MLKNLRELVIGPSGEDRLNCWLVDVVDGTLSEPVAPEAGASADVLSVHEKELKKFEKADALAQLILVTLMENFFTCEKDSSENITTHIARLQRNFSELNDELRK
ncbi:hypothetical protein PPYR_14562 [Photinus pyralis]|uniref:Uncharacterized protein n=1 Tax=Photinus pyralis TaxID=7054 RepID=A0A5N4A5K4_PHOPY|nr:hypothetical protein PPYR_14562 [Photinus pyralis]